MEDPRLYRLVASDLRREIRIDRVRKPGDRVSIKYLAQTYGYSRRTIGKALRLLEAEGLIRRYPGLGYVVQEREHS